MNNEQLKFNKGKTVAVLGAGIIGINCALELQSLGFQVSLIDKAGIGEGCSKRNAGHFATEQVFPLAEASLLLKLPKFLLDPLGPMALSPSYFPKALPWFFKFISNMMHSKRAKNTAALKTINKHAVDYYRPILDAAGAQHLITSKGSLLVFESTKRKNAEKVFTCYKNAGIAVKLLDRAQTLLLEPNLSANVHYSLYFTDVAHTANPLAISKVLANQAMKLGTTFIHAEVSTINYFENNEKVALDLQENYQGVAKNTTQLFDQIVIAAGAWSAPLLAQLGYKLPIEAERGYSLDLPHSVETNLTRPVASAERKCIITPMEHGLRIAGTAEFAGLTKVANMKRANMLYKNAQELVSDIAEFSPQDAEPDQRWMGCRPSLPDSLPVIGQAPRHNNIFLALGHQHLGLTLGAITGKLIGQVMTGQKTDIDIRPFTISRFN